MVRMSGMAGGRAVLSALVGAALGLGVYTFVYARGYSYFSNDSSGRYHLFMGDPNSYRRYNRWCCWQQCCKHQWYT